MGNVLSKGVLFPPQLTNELINKVRGKSSIARLVDATPMRFTGKTLFTFSLDKEVDVVGENGAKSNGGATLGTVSMAPVKIEYGCRVSDEFIRASDEIRLEYLRAFSEGFAKKAARGLDIMAFHGVNPRTKLAATTIIGNNHFDAQVENVVAFNPLTPDSNVSAAIGLIEEVEHEVTGMAMSPAFRTALADLKQGQTSNVPLFPDLSWGNNPGSIRGLTVDSNSTVSFNGSVDRAIIGNFLDFFRWGYAAEIPVRIIEYGNPDNDAEAGDLQGHNQVYLRSELYLGWAILDPTAFTRIIASALSLDKTTATVAEDATTTITATGTPSGGTVTWASSNEAVATVSSAGVVTGVAAGTATITACYMGAKATCAVTVTA